MLGKSVIYLEDLVKIIYIVTKIEGEMAHIKGENYRIYRVVSKEKIRLASSEEKLLEEKRNNEYYSNFKIKEERILKKKYLLGRILHLDGDKDYLDKCMDFYQKIGLKVEGVCLSEKEMPEKIINYIKKINPNIIVITGHDLYNGGGVKDLNNYTNTKYFIETVKNIRNIKSSLDCCVIAGACQSNFEALVASGADFASSPQRVNIHTFDPAIVAIKVASTSFLKKVDFNEILKYIENGRKAFGGVETLGKMKLVL